MVTVVCGAWSLDLLPAPSSRKHHVRFKWFVQSAFSATVNLRPDWPWSFTDGATPISSSGEIMKDEEIRELHAVRASEARPNVVTTWDEAYHRYRLLAMMVQGTPSVLPEAWRSYRNVEEARIGAQEMLHNDRVLRVAIVKDRIPLQFVEWVVR
jgi:hypothetical protein